MSGQWSGGMLVTTAAIISLQIAQGRSADELSLLAAFFTVLGDNLALIAEQLPEDTAALPAGNSGNTTATVTEDTNATAVDKRNTKLI